MTLTQLIMSLHGFIQDYNIFFIQLIDLFVALGLEFKSHLAKFSILCQLSNHFLTLAILPVAKPETSKFGSANVNFWNPKNFKTPLQRNKIVKKLFCVLSFQLVC